jgi:phage gp36-like protein
VYSSPTDVRFALTPGGDEADKSTAAILEDDQITDAIKEADGTIDTYIFSLFGIPQDPDTPEVAVYPVRAWSRDIAAYLATLTYRKFKDYGEDEPVRQRYKFVIDLLDKIAAGKLRPNLPQPPDPGDGVGPQGAFVYNVNSFKLFRPSDIWVPPPWARGGRNPAWTYVQDHRYWDLLIAGSGYNEVLVLFEGQPIPFGTPDDTLVIFIPPEGP